MKNPRKTNSELVEINSQIIFPKAQIVFAESDMLFVLSVMDNNKKYPRLCESRIFMRMGNESRIFIDPIAVALQTPLTLTQLRRTMHD